MTKKKRECKHMHQKEKGAYCTDFFFSSDRSHFLILIIASSHFSKDWPARDYISQPFLQPYVTISLN